MAAEQTGEALLTPFLLKTYQLVDDPAVDDSISWNGDGSGFIIWRPEEFARDLLPKYFKHNNLSSFVRQLNTYGFRKVVPDRWEFANDFFKRGEKGLLRDIQRRKMTPTTSSATPDITSAAGGLLTVQTSVPSSGEEHMFSSSSSPVRRQVKDSSSAPELVEENEQRRVMNSTSPELVEENERLEKENQQMTNELSHLRGLCSNIFTLMSGYGPSGEQDTGNQSMESKQLDLLQSGRYLEEQGGSSGGAMEDISPKLFGVSIGAKRRKLSEEDEIGHRQHQQDEAQTENHNGSNTAQSEMKQEPGLS